MGCVTKSQIPAFAGMTALPLKGTSLRLVRFFVLKVLLLRSPQLAMTVQCSLPISITIFLPTSLPKSQSWNGQARGCLLWIANHAVLVTIGLVVSSTSSRLIVSLCSTTHEFFPLVYVVTRRA